MAPRSYPRLSIEDFGAQLLKSGDIDPVYIALNAMEWSEVQRNRWLVAYISFYHPGLASWLSEAEGLDFWELMMTAAVNEEVSPIGARFPRAPERRHFRGENAVKSVDYMRTRYGKYPQAMMDYICGPMTYEGVTSYKDIQGRALEHYGIGAWACYKLADLAERCCGVPLVWTEADAMYESPQRGALAIWRAKLGYSEEAQPKDRAKAIHDVVQYLLDHFKDYDAPGGGRKFGLPEVETCCCKYLSHLNGHYGPNNDLIEIKKGLDQWRLKSETADRLIYYFPKVL